ncbi:hypothetical protein [Desulfocicer vacuolatum]|uniref:hypothetical protein n=1 Tax=Desulfocicer vacuolatum TaxID=2298 RepID=UPI001BB02CF3|nr:hypothetical protein [Desulfocicer vacuolatum]
MKYSANRGCISSFVVGRAGSEYGPPMAVIKKLSANLGRASISVPKPPSGRIATSLYFLPFLQYAINSFE